MLAHLSKKEFRFYRAVILPLVLAVSNAAYGRFMNRSPPFNEVWTLYATVLFAFFLLGPFRGFSDPRANRGPQHSSI